MKTVVFKMKRTVLFVSVLLLTFFIAAPSVLGAITITEYGGLADANSQPHNIALGPDGNIGLLKALPIRLL